MRTTKEVNELLAEVGGMVPKNHQAMDYACGVLDALEWVLADTRSANRAGMIEEIQRGRDRGVHPGGRPPLLTKRVLGGLS